MCTFAYAVSISTKQAQNWATQHYNVPYFETRCAHTHTHTHSLTLCSAKDAINVETAFHKAAHAAMLRIPDEPPVTGDSVDIKKIEAEKGRGCCG